MLLLLAVGASACVGYPNIFLTGRRGRLPLYAGSNVGTETVKISIVRDCQKAAENYEIIGKSAEVKPDARGRYHVSISGFAWDWINLVTGAYCRSFTRLYRCLRACRALNPENQP